MSSTRTGRPVRPGKAATPNRDAGPGRRLDHGNGDASSLVSRSLMAFPRDWVTGVILIPCWLTGPTRTPSDRPTQPRARDAQAKGRRASSERKTLRPHKARATLAARRATTALFGHRGDLREDGRNLPYYSRPGLE